MLHLAIERRCGMKNSPFSSTPSCRQTTLAALILKRSLHTVPHCPLAQISNLPLCEFILPSNSLTSPVTLQASATHKTRKLNFAVFKYEWKHSITVATNDHAPHLVGSTRRCTSATVKQERDVHVMS